MEKGPQLACDVLLAPSYIFYWVSQRPLLNWVGGSACSCSELTSCLTLQPLFSFPTIPYITLYDFCSSKAKLPMAFHSYHASLCVWCLFAMPFTLLRTWVMAIHSEYLVGFTPYQKFSANSNCPHPPSLKKLYCLSPPLDFDLLKQWLANCDL